MSVSEFIGTLHHKIPQRISGNHSGIHLVMDGGIQIDLLSWAMVGENTINHFGPSREYDVRVGFTTIEMKIKTVPFQIFASLYDADVPDWNERRSLHALTREEISIPHVFLDCSTSDHLFEAYIWNNRMPDTFVNKRVQITIEPKPL